MQRPGPDRAQASRPSGRTAVVAAAAIAAVCAALAAASETGGSAALGGAEAPTAAARERVVLGRSVRGRPISAARVGPADAPRTVLVVGVIHGDETAGGRIARLLETGPAPERTQLWVVRDLNPDGVAARTRQNARGVDLNRNFPHRWRRLPRGRHWSGPRPLSEPESRIARRLILRIRPDLTLWFHQPFGIVVRGGADRRTERRVARALGLPLRPLYAVNGSVSNWQHAVLGQDALVVELPGGRLSDREARRYAQGVRRLAP